MIFCPLSLKWSLSYNMEDADPTNDWGKIKINTDTARYFKMLIETFVRAFSVMWALWRLSRVRLLLEDREGVGAQRGGEDAEGLLHGASTNYQSC